MKKWRMSTLLTGIIICILGGYVILRGSSQIWDSWKLQIVQDIQEHAEMMYFPGIACSEKQSEKRSVNEWISGMAMNLYPLGKYIGSKSDAESAVEDEATYEMLVRRQAEDENQVDENGNFVGEDESLKTQTPSVAAADISLEKLSDFEYLVSNFYTVDSVTYVEESDLNAAKLLQKDMKIQNDAEGPKVLIFHTHSQESFIDSNGDPSTSIVGIGRYLTELLTDKYHIETLHHEGVYDLIDGKLDRSEAYELAQPEIERILKENPGIEVVIDLHRDGVKSTTHLVTEINGKQTAQVMFFNGMCRTRANGNLTGMTNPYIQDNLAFSLQMKIAAESKYPGFARRIYLKGYKYNMDLCPKMLLIEAGAQTNTVEEMRNAMEPLAELLNDVLK
ncbi:MAG: stage II sporulation protein P [Bariatricus sp.]